MNTPFRLRIESHKAYFFEGFSITKRAGVIEIEGVK